jgi:hypothetical protein
MVVPSPGIFVPGSYGVPKYQHIKVSLGCACAMEAGATRAVRAPTETAAAALSEVKREGFMT